MKLQRKALVRNLVIAMVVADGVGIYFLQDRLSNPLNDSAAAFEEEALALAASESAKPQAAPQQAPSQQALASRELPKPAFGTPEAAPTVAAKPVAAQPAPVQAAAKPALAKAPAAAPAVAAPAAKPAAKAAPALTAKRTIAVPRIAAVTSSKTPVTLSVTPSSKAAKAKAPERKRATFAKAIGFTKAFGVSRAVPAIAVTTASGSLHQAGPVITADFAPDTTAPQVETVETAPIAMASQPELMAEPAPTVSVPSEAPSVELPSTDE